MQRRPKTFTLIEMLIVMTIIGILASALIPRLRSVQERARDAKRKVDLRTIYNGLVTYREDNGGKYPYPTNTYGVMRDGTGGGWLLIPNFTWNEMFNTISSTGSFSSGGTMRIGELAGYMTTMPLDPVNVITPANVAAATAASSVLPFGPWNAGNYVYTYGWLWKNRTTFTLSTALENVNDPDRCEIKGYLRLYNTTYIRCFAGNPQDNVIYMFNDNGT